MIYHSGSKSPIEWHAPIPWSEEVTARADEPVGCLMREMSGYVFPWVDKLPVRLPKQSLKPWERKSTNEDVLLAWSIGSEWNIPGPYRFWWDYERSPSLTLTQVLMTARFIEGSFEKGTNPERLPTSEHLPFALTIGDVAFVAARNKEASNPVIGKSIAPLFVRLVKEWEAGRNEPYSTFAWHLHRMSYTNFAEKYHDSWMSWSKRAQVVGLGFDMTIAYLEAGVAPHRILSLFEQGIDPHLMAVTNGSQQL